ncbi:hypothetical protein CBG04_07835 [Limosilactobacillus reuteri]|uniref:hypothetical protein n=1 Tax=Limosilactobacillus reuteri TaxID=1598 RepID=UPI000B98178A|nr:hypothetical protein [Limosilactobacillus reuteri]OYS78985.1 hypothetical protein CBG11_10495 [Limosilactobacillus reuteri]OYS82691.1 hypothetical protein CBG04_07835 [Limosilactobacillus reuteri]OYS84337.1 hypothetical protein CBG14_05620 [Limosilactobacillus reuteri]
MSLLDAYKKATTNWNAKEDKVNQSQVIPTGTYEVMLGKVDHPVYKSGWDCLRFDMQVIVGKYASRHEQIRVSLATKTTKGNAVPEFVVSRNIRTIAKIGEMVGLEMKPDYFPDNETDAYEKLVTAFKPYEGKTLQMIITETPNKKDPDNPYRNYDFSESRINVEEPKPTENGETDTTIEDGDLPF